MTAIPQVSYRVGYSGRDNGRALQTAALGCPSSSTTLPEVPLWGARWAVPAPGHPQHPSSVPGLWGAVGTEGEKQCWQLFGGRQQGFGLSSYSAWPRLRFLIFHCNQDHVPPRGFIGPVHPFLRACSELQVVGISVPNWS